MGKIAEWVPKEAFPSTSCKELWSVLELISWNSYFYFKKKKVGSLYFLQPLSELWKGWPKSWQSGRKASGPGSLLRELKNRWEFWRRGFCKVCVKSRASSCVDHWPELPYTCLLFSLDCLPISLYIPDLVLGRIFIPLRECEVEHPGLHQLQTVSQMKVFTYF